MLEHTKYEIIHEGKREIHIILPCFSCEISKKHREFDNAIRMNRFYSALGDRMYEYALSFSDENIRRMQFNCTYSVLSSESSNAEDQIITVTLELSLRRFYYHNSCPTLRKQLKHIWKDGILQRNIHK